MKRHFLILNALLAGLSLTAVAADNHEHHATTASNPGFEKLKTLVGTWVTADENGNPTDEIVSVVRLTAGGSAIHETLFPGQPMEMVSIYTAEGSDVVMTHYCMLGNQPRMKAGSTPPSNQLKFEFVDGGNLDPQKDTHMHSAVLTFVDDDHITMDGVGWENGQPAKEMCGQMKLVRKK